MLKKQFTIKCMFASLAILVASCSKDDNTNANPEPAGKANYILGVGITVSSGSTSATTNYVLKTNDLTTGVITPVGNGLTLVGYRDYYQGNNTIFAMGGLGELNINGINQNDSGKLVISGTTTLDISGDDCKQVDDAQMLELKIPTKAQGDNVMFNFINIATKGITKALTSPVEPLRVAGNTPVYTGMAIRNNQMFISYMHNDATGGLTSYTDTNYVAVYTYPECVLQSIIKDPRTGPSGAWATKNGLFIDEKGDIYSMSSSNISNGYSQSTKPGGFLKIKSGTTAFDQSYFFETDKLGGKISHIKYLGNGKVFATISTLTTQSVATDRWQDKSLKMAIIDVYNQTITDVKLNGDANALIHNGNGGRTFPVLYDEGKVYYTATIGTSANIYIIDPAAATATKGAQVDATFVGGIFRVK